MSFYFFFFSFLFFGDTDFTPRRSEIVFDKKIMLTIIRYHIDSQQIAISVHCPQSLSVIDYISDKFLSAALVPLEVTCY